MQQNKQENQISKTSDAGLLKMRLRFVKNDLTDALEKVESAMSQIEDKELHTWLEIAQDQLVDTLTEIEEREDKVESLIKSIAS